MTTRRLLMAALFVFALIGWLPTASRAADTFQCQSGPDPAIVNACSVRWEAANIRAHIAGQSFGGGDPSCLDKTATLFDGVAGQWMAADKFTAFHGPWPCGLHPAIATDDDGVLATTCPKAAWSYSNRGLPPSCLQLAGSFQCSDGRDPAIVDACGARWEAANIRAHILIGRYAGASPDCLKKTAAVLEDAAAHWIAADKAVAFTGPWPCGSHPAAASTDDGTLRARCPDLIWSYENRGVAKCLALSTGSTNDLAQVLSQQYVIRSWDYGAIGDGNAYDRAKTSTVVIAGCDFTINTSEQSGKGAGAAIQSDSWKGKLRDVDPETVNLFQYIQNSEPVQFAFTFSSIGDALFTHEGSRRDPDPRRSVLIELIAPAFPPVVPFQALVRHCSGAH
jgi:hypothetical protein